MELDPEVAKTYRLNHNPQYLYNEDIRDFNKREDLPAELYQLDLLDGSPPCSTFSTAGSRDKAWGKEKRFAEGQKLQTLDDLVFVYCDTILKLRPKCFILENVSGIIKGNAKSYSKRIVAHLTANGYTVQVFLLNASTMGVPQKRERVFFVGHRKEYDLPKLVLDFNEKPITFGEVYDHHGEHPCLSDYLMERWKQRIPSDAKVGDINLRVYGKISRFSVTITKKNEVLPTLTATDAQNRDYLSYEEPIKINETEIKTAGTFPLDYQSPYKDIGWLAGMSVPPIMAAQLSYQIYRQWLSKIKAGSI